MTYNKAAFDGNLSVASVAGQIGPFTIGAPNPEFSDAPTQPGVLSAIAKRAFDIAFVVALAPVALPIIAVCAAKIRKDGGPAFFGQDRVGKDGRIFKCWKLRSMVQNAESLLTKLMAEDSDLREEYNRVQKLKNDPRVTKIGKFIRKTSIDELPQLWNVLIGDMSVVGPRPRMPSEFAVFNSDRTTYLSMRPGITGLWQVEGRGEVTFDERIAMDVRYHSQKSFWFDLKICLKTALVVLNKTGV